MGVGNDLTRDSVIKSTKRFLLIFLVSRGNGITPNYTLVVKVPEHYAVRARSARSALGTVTFGRNPIRELEPPVDEPLSQNRVEHASLAPILGGGTQGSARHAVRLAIPVVDTARPAKMGFSLRCGFIQTPQ